MRTRCGACVARARLQARFGRPMPTNTTSPSDSSRAATAAIISSGVYAASEPVVDSGALALLRLEPAGEARLFRQIGGAVRDAVDELVEVAPQLGGIARDRLPRDVEVIVAVVIALRVRRVRPPRLHHDRVHDHSGDRGAVRVRADHALVDQLFYDDD